MPPRGDLRDEVAKLAVEHRERLAKAIAEELGRPAESELTSSDDVRRLWWTTAPEAGQSPLDQMAYEQQLFGQGLGLLEIAAKVYPHRQTMLLRAAKGSLARAAAFAEAMAKRGPPAPGPEPAADEEVIG